MSKLGSLVNLDLLSVGISVAGICILGFAVFFNNKKSSTNRTFLAFSISAFFWSVSNYLIYQFQLSELILLITRLHMLFSVLYSFLIFRLFFVFPSEKTKFPKIYRSLILPAVVITSILTLTPLVLSRVTDQTAGEVAVISPGPGIAVFGVVVISLIISGIVILSKRMRKTEKKDRAAFKFIITGVSITFALHIIFNFLMPIVFKNPRFVPLGAVFTFPFVALTSYAIFRHHLLNIKVITTEIIAFLLAVVTLFEVILSDNPLTLIFRSGIFVLVLAFGILLIKSVLKEVEQREELAKINIELRKAKLELEKLSRFKTQMLSFASHQIKAPLATIKGFASILVEGLYGEINGKVKETIHKMKNSADELINLINTLLDMRKVEEGRMEYKFEPVKIKELVLKTVEELQFQAKEKHLELTLEANFDPEVTADPQKLKQVIQNLVENAIKYTPEGFIHVKLGEHPSTSSGQGGSVIFSVTDTGLGISKELLPKLFSQEFVRDNKVKGQIKGTGLGLYIANQIIKDHGGTIWAESDGENKGSRFYFKLPKVK